MRRGLEFLLVLVLCPITILLLKDRLFQLEPLSQWKFPIGLSLALSEVGTVVALYWPKKKSSIGKKIWTLLLASGVFALLMYLYHLATETPPAQRWVAWYNIGAYACFCMLYIAYGYVLGRLYTVITDHTFEYLRERAQRHHPP